MCASCSQVRFGELKLCGWFTSTSWPRERQGENIYYLLPDEMPSFAGNQWGEKPFPPQRPPAKLQPPLTTHNTFTIGVEGFDRFVRPRTSETFAPRELHPTRTDAGLSEDLGDRNPWADQESAAFNTGPRSCQLDRPAVALVSPGLGRDCLETLSQQLAYSHVDRRDGRCHMQLVRGVLRRNFDINMGAGKSVPPGLRFCQRDGVCRSRSVCAHPQRQPSRQTVECVACNLRLDVRGRFQDTTDGIFLYDLVSAADLQLLSPRGLFLASLARRRRLQMGNPEDGQAPTQSGVRSGKSQRLPRGLPSRSSAYCRASRCHVQFSTTHSPPFLSLAQKASRVPAVQRFIH